MQASDSAVGYVKDEPVKAMLAAAATGRCLDGPDRHDEPLARLTVLRSVGTGRQRGAAMIHPLLRLIVTEPHVVGDHVEAYAELVSEEVKKAGSAWALRIGLYAAALCLAVMGLIFTGVAIMLWGAQPTADYTAGWVLIVVPLVTFALAAICIVVAMSKPIESALDNVAKQLDADMAMLRMRSTPDGHHFSGSL